MLINLLAQDFSIGPASHRQKSALGRKRAKKQCANDKLQELLHLLHATCKYFIHNGLGHLIFFKVRKKPVFVKERLGNAQKAFRKYQLNTFQSYQVHLQCFQVHFFYLDRFINCISFNRVLFVINQWRLEKQIACQ